MKKYIHDPKNGLWYELQGEYYIIYLSLHVSETQPIRVWGRRHLQFIRENKPILYTTLLLNGRLNEYLS